MPDLSVPLGAGAERPRQDPYSWFVAAAKRLLPLLALGLLAMVALWPEVNLSLPRFTALPKLDPREAHDLRMLNPQYSGVDRENRPFTLTADAARQLSADINDLIGLDGPKADMTSASGGWVEISAYTGTYRPQPQILELFGNVALFIDRGDEFHTDNAKVDLVNNSAEGNDKVNGQGPFGTVIADGFRVLDRGDTVIFTGHADLTLDPERHQEVP